MNKIKTWIVSGVAGGLGVGYATGLFGSDDLGIWLIGLLLIAVGLAALLGRVDRRCP